jgi:hypothetical protein
MACRPEVLKRGRQALEQVLAGLSRLLPVIRDVMSGEAIDGELSRLNTDNLS